MSRTNGPESDQRGPVEAGPDTEHDAYGIRIGPAHKFAWAAVTGVLGQRGHAAQRKIGDAPWSYSALTTGLVRVEDEVRHGRLLAVCLSVDLPGNGAPGTPDVNKRLRRPTQRWSTEQARQALDEKQVGVVLECWQLAATANPDSLSMPYKEVSLTPEMASDLRLADSLRKTARSETIWTAQGPLGAAVCSVVPPAPNAHSELVEGGMSLSALRVQYMEVAGLLQPLLDS